MFVKEYKEIFIYILQSAHLCFVYINDLYKYTITRIMERIQSEFDTEPYVQYTEPGSIFSVMDPEEIYRLYRETSDSMARVVYRDMLMTNIVYICTDSNTSYSLEKALRCAKDMSIDITMRFPRHLEDEVDRDAFISRSYEKYEMEYTPDLINYIFWLVGFENSSPINILHAIEAVKTIISSAHTIGLITTTLPDVVSMLKSVDTETMACGDENGPILEFLEEYERLRD